MANVNEVTRFICLFHDAGRARAAVQALESADFVSGRVDTLSREDSSAGSLEALGAPDRDISRLRSGIEQGGVVVSLQAPENYSDDIERIFHKFSADKIDERELETQHVAALATPPVVPATPSNANGEMVIPIAEEELVVGKREVDRGGVRVYRHTVEKAVSENIDLHDERVVLEHRQVNRPATDADVRAGEQEIELIETAEVPVVQKVARVVEEVRVGKTGSDHTEVIQDSVRHTEVDVEQIGSDSTRSALSRDRD